MSGELDLSVRVGRVTLPTPVLVASGTFGYGSESPELTRAGELGGIVTKTITLEPRRGNEPLRLHETPAGLINSIGLQNVGVDRFREEKLPKLRALGVPIIASVGGRRAEEFVETVQRLEGVDGIVAYEINVSCPNVKEGGIEFCQRPESAAEVITAVRNVTKLPLWTKLSPNVSHIGVVAKACADAGADAFTAVNTFVGLSVDVKTRRSHIPLGTGGVSGPAIRPLALAKVRETVRATPLPVVGCGGIASANDALQFLVVGASAVQVGTASFRVPDIAARIQDGMKDFLRSEGLTSIGDLIGSYLDPSGPARP
ncbi:MAG: dihydroorotate dehydrogenase [Candidatus Eisenbacteria bacterium]|uniref:Dihydroorotate dehydrogenase n=1 Tax=Eiseniibacteriota bacterium TaxID=2212470 RepID=A0A956NB01_UNCEI|nr:dihydroorotate dehydrogenase [Candidatus Eisenbacteria bacterium]